jgi:hypothetical protein
MHRRRFLSLLVCGPALVPAAFAHTPYRQWKVFRQRHLLVMTTRDDLAGDALGDRFVEVLLAELPQSRAMVSRARHLERIASLITTDQASVAVLSREHARALFRGEPPFAGYGPYPLRLLVESGNYLLVCRDDVPLHHGYLIAASLMGHADALAARIPVAADIGIPLHPGAQAFVRGETVEPPP